MRYLDENGLLYVVKAIKGWLGNKVDKVEGKGLSTNDLTNELLEKLMNAGDSTFSGVYADLTNKPKINGVELGTNNTLADLGIQAAGDYATNEALTTGLSGKVDKVSGKGLSTNDYTTAEKNKLAGIAENAQVNTIESIKVNGTAQTITDKAVDIKVPTKVSELTNDSEYMTKTEVNTALTAINEEVSEQGIKLSGIEENAQVNKIETIKVNGTAQTITSKSVDIEVPTALSDLDNDGNFVTDASYVHTDNNYTTTEKTKLAGVETNAQVNLIEKIQVNGTEQAINNKIVNITVPTKTSDLTNDSSFQTEAQVTDKVTAATADKVTTTQMNNAISTATTDMATKTYVTGQISSAIAGVTQFDYQVVTELPTTGVKGTIYLIANSGSNPNIYDEYLYVNNNWELFGTTELDLSGYVKTSDLTALTNAEIDDIFAQAE